MSSRLIEYEAMLEVVNAQQYKSLGTARFHVLIRSRVGFCSCEGCMIAQCTTFVARWWQGAFDEAVTLG